MKLPQVHFGKVGAQPKKWREEKIREIDDDDELKNTPPEVLKMLGFDPKEISEIKKHK